jgi:hypothetical protein
MAFDQFIDGAWGVDEVQARVHDDTISFAWSIGITNE